MQVELDKKVTVITKDGGERKLPFDPNRMVAYMEEHGVHDKTIQDKVITMITSYEEFQAQRIPRLLIDVLLEEVDEANPQYVNLSAQVLLTTMYKQAGINRRAPKMVKYGDYADLIEMLVEKGVYHKDLLNKYSRAELKQAGTFIDPEKDKLFTYQAVDMLRTRYLATGKDKSVYELPQERWLTIALWLMQDEDKENRMEYVKEAYWALSNLLMTVATPTLANAGKAHPQLSSCFIDTVDDSLQSIYDSNTDVANLSKHGGGIGVYIGKVRGLGSAIRGHKGASSGTIPWIRQLNNTAVSVDQLGTRQGAIAVYQDVWHRDIMQHLDLKLNNGDERMRAHDIFLGVTLPDLFMETVEARGDWYLFDPHEVREVMGFSLEDYYDEEFGSGSFREKYMECVNDSRLTKDKVPAIDIMKRIMRSQMETGTPFMFYRDEVNRANPNKHEGMIYSSNLCTEIAQNMSPTTQISQELLEDGTVITKKKSGDFVVCNLSSINLGRVRLDEEVLERLISIQVRMLDNVIDINDLPVKQARHTNLRYRAIGLGTFGWHHLLALEGIYWESDEAVELTDKLYELIAYHTIKASKELAEEKGAYPLFEGSDWQTGEYFTQRGYFETTDVETVREGSMTDKWKKLHAEIVEHGVRNGYMMAVAPNMSTSIIAGSTASIDPIFKPFYSEEKKSGKYPTVAPDLDHNTYEYYRKSVYHIDQFWSVKQNIARQRHVDQAISFNIYVPNTIRASILLDLHMQVWKGRGKSTYYIRSTANEVEDCEWCSS